MKLKFIFILFFYLSYAHFGKAQSCQGFYKTSRCAVKNSSGFKQYAQARSAAVEVGKKYTFAAVLYGKKDFIVSVCSDGGYKNIHYKIYNRTTNELIYDNAEDSYNKAVAFSAEKTSNIEIEVEILYDKERGIDPENYRVCIGVQILWRKIPQLGF